ncbi:MAG: MerR family transcriptional regulator [Lachnospiraceae bacterium]|nr:MerR family transcriptional regulator [Lachnospiraceae bacterium]
MTIKEVEERTGLARSNVRFYEKEGLIQPSRNERNGYRDYSEGDIEDIIKIAYLRTLGISVEEIRSMISETITLREVIQRQRKVLEEQLTDLNQSKAMCDRMLSTDDISYASLQVAQYVTEPQDYWKDNQTVFKLDAVSFLYIWGSLITWIAITGLCLTVGMVFYAKLPLEIPVQWSDGTVTSLVKKEFIFAYPAVCVVIRYLLRPCLYAKLQMSNPHAAIMTEYLSNYLCFIALSVEIFSILFVYGLVRNIVTVLFVDTVVLIGILIRAVSRNGHK